MTKKDQAEKIGRAIADQVILGNLPSECKARLMLEIAETIGPRAYRHMYSTCVERIQEMNKWVRDELPKTRIDYDPNYTDGR